MVIATSGPGATNLVTGIATAFLDSIPMVAITGNVPNNQIDKPAAEIEEGPVGGVDALRRLPDALLLGGGPPTPPTAGPGPPGSPAWSSPPPAPK